MTAEERVRMMVGNLVVENCLLAAKLEEKDKQLQELKDKLGEAPKTE